LACVLTCGYNTYDAAVVISLSSSIPPTASSFKTSFAGGATIYPQEEGLAPGDYFAFRVLSGDGSLVDTTLPGIQQVPPGSTGYGAGSFNTSDLPLPDGSYRIELVRVEQRRGYVVTALGFIITT